MASKQQQATEKLKVENAQQENNKEKVQDAEKSELSTLPLETKQYCIPRCTRRRFRVRQPILQYRWDMVPRAEEPQQRVRDENVENIGDDMRQLVDKLRDKQSSHCLRAVSTDPPHQDHQDTFCLMP